MINGARLWYPEPWKVGVALGLVLSGVVVSARRTKITGFDPPLPTTGTGSSGHYSWDTEIFVLPFLT
jgi:hypothetical protein